MSVRTLVWPNVVLLALAGITYAEDAPAVAVPTAVPVSATPSATPVTPSASVIRSSSSINRKLQPHSVTINLTDGMKLTGELTEVDQWSMKTTFGSTNLPLSTVAGIRMAQEGNAITTVVLHNGDNLTGAIQLDLVVIQTEWGRAEINGNHIASILFTPGLKWSSETGLNGMRWKLVADEPARPAPNAAAGQRGGQPGAPGTPGMPGVPANQARPGTQPVFQPQPGFRQ